MFCDKNPILSHTCGCIYDDDNGKRQFSKIQSDENFLLDELEVLDSDIEESSQSDGKSQKRPIFKFQKKVAGKERHRENDKISLKSV